MALPHQSKVSSPDHKDAGSHGEPSQEVRHTRALQQQDTRQQSLVAVTKIYIGCKEPIFHNAHTVKSSAVEEVAQRESTTSILRNFQNLAEQGPDLPLKLTLL